MPMAAEPQGGEMISCHDNTAGCDASRGYRKADVVRYEKYVVQP